MESNPELQQFLGTTLITTDGTTLLGGDDKAGVAIMMELAETLAEQSSLPRGEVKLLFTCDEEIGRGVDHVDFEKLGATACYTLDGGGANDVDIETFSADLAIVSIQGENIHPAIAKDRMVNALRVGADMIERLPKDQSPERTEYYIFQQHQELRCPISSHLQSIQHNELILSYFHQPFLHFPFH